VNRCVRALLSRDLSRSLAYPDLVMQITDPGSLSGDLSPIMDWKLIDTAPFNRDLELAVIDPTGANVVAFPCRLTDKGWFDAETNKRVYFSYIRPTHWRNWSPN
jgi:hypothetical protein